MTRKLLSCLLLTAALALNAAAPDGYYSGITGLTDSALKTKLYEIISQHSENSYSGLFSESFIYTDVRDNNTWWDMYSNTERSVYSAGRVSWTGLNREHSFPKSWWGGDQNAAYTDLNHLYPADASANTAKNNYPLGEVDDDQITFDNGLSLVGHPVLGQGGNCQYVFEPADEYKGDFARTYFYMVTRYQNLSWKYQYMALNGTYPTLQGWAIDLLLKWHRNDPVSDKETARNDAVYQLQGNRNPFIDYPNLVEYIWGTMIGEPFEDADLPPIGEGTLISPEDGATVDFGDVVAGTVSTKSVNIRGSLTENLSLKVYGTDASQFTIPVSSVSWQTVNDTGYELEITYSPKAAGDSSAKLLLYDGGLTASSYILDLKGTAHAMPTFDDVVATAATNVSTSGFQANWNTPANPDVIDCYVVNITEYTSGSSPVTTSVSTDGDETYLYYSDLTAGATYSYTVQSVRYNVKSGESNAVSVDPNGSVSGVDASKPLAVASISSGIRFVTTERHTNVRIVDLAGRVVSLLPTVDNGRCVLLPFGAYLVYSDQHPRPLKVLVRDF